MTEQGATSRDGGAPRTGALDSAFSALDRCDVLLAKLEAGCCDPGRSPRMTQLSETLRLARTLVRATLADSGVGNDAIDGLEDDGEQIGRLQVGCCTPKRVPLYAEMLERLTDAQIGVSRATGSSHS